MDSDNVDASQGVKDLFYTIPEVMHVLNVSRAMIYTLIDKGDLNRLRMGGKVLFRKSEVQAYIESL